MTESVVCPPASGPVVGFAVSGVYPHVKVRCKKDSERSLQLLVSYLAFCSRQNVRADIALDILEACRADLALCEADGNTAFIEAYYRVADLAFKTEA